MAELLRKRILLVDDEIGIRLTLPHILSKHGFDVTSVASLEDAVAEIQTDSFDALLSDLNLPAANQGFRVIEEMRRFQPHCVNFILTGYPAEATATQATHHQVAHYFIKPVDIAELVGTINKKLVENPLLKDNKTQD